VPEPVIAVVDYGVGNLASVRKAFAAVGARAELVRDPARLRGAAALVTTLAYAVPVVA
jgi:glutamine amidotransferase